VKTLRRGGADPHNDSKERLSEGPTTDNQSANASATAPVGTDIATEETTTADDASTEKSSESHGADDQETKDAEDPEGAAQSKSRRFAKATKRIAWSRVLAFGLLPAVALLIASAAAFLKWEDLSSREGDTARIESVQAARDSTIALLSYRPDTVEKDLGAARERLTGNFRDSYTSLTHDVVIPGAKQKQISAIATVPAASSVLASETHAVVMVFVNQTVIVGQDAPTDTARRRFHRQSGRNDCDQPGLGDQRHRDT
jgi:Mce-associated membrane protein